MVAIASSRNLVRQCPSQSQAYLDPPRKSESAERYFVALCFYAPVVVQMLDSCRFVALVDFVAEAVVAELLVED